MTNGASKFFIAPVIAFALIVSSPTPALGAKTYKNCAALNKVYKHGVGKPHAKDYVSGKAKPVLNFKKSKALYKANKSKDRDKDGIACEKH